MSRQQGRPGITSGTLKTAKRLLKYVTGTYKVQFIVVIFCILISSIASISVPFPCVSCWMTTSSADRTAGPGLFGALHGAPVLGIISCAA